MSTSRTPRYITHIQYADGFKTVQSDDKPVVVQIDMNNWTTIRDGWFSRAAGTCEVHVHMDSMTRVQVAVHKHDLPIRAPEYFKSLGEALVRAEELVREQQALVQQLDQIIGLPVEGNAQKRAVAVPSTRSILGKHLHAGDWLAYSNPRMNQRVVDVQATRDDQVKVLADYGNGGEPATLFFGEYELVLILNEAMSIR